MQKETFVVAVAAAAAAAAAVPLQQFAQQLTSVIAPSSRAV